MDQQLHRESVCNRHWVFPTVKTCCSESPNSSWLCGLLTLCHWDFLFHNVVIYVCDYRVLIVCCVTWPPSQQAKTQQPIGVVFAVNSCYTASLVSTYVTWHWRVNLLYVLYMEFSTNIGSTEFQKPRYFLSTLCLESMPPHHMWQLARSRLGSAELSVGYW